MRKIITASFFTTINKIKAKKALNFLWPWNWSKWQTGEYANKLPEAIKKYIGLKYSVSFYRGRDAMLAGLKALGIVRGDEVILQAFTCVSVPNAIIACGARPVYADIIGSSKFKVQSSKFFDYNIDPKEIKKKITKNTKAVLIQHTFGIPADIEPILTICRQYNLYLIEDCAHALGASYKSKDKNKKVGSFGNIAIFSFGRDKIISGVAGGLLATNDEKIYQQIKKLSLNSNKGASNFLIFRCFLYEIIFYLGKILYSFYLGKIIVWLAKKLSLAPKVLTKQEKSGQAESAFGPMPNALAKLAYLDFLKLELYNQKRRQIAEIYYQRLKNIAEIILPGPAVRNKNFCSAHQSEAVFLRFAIQAPEPQKLYEYMKKRGVLMANWYSNIIDPAGVNLEKIGYRPGMCPQSEQAALGVVNLPAHQNMSLTEAEYVAEKIKKFFEKKLY